MKTIETLEELLAQAAPHSRYWLSDAVTNARDGAGDSVSEAADDFVSANGRDSHRLANQILVAMGEKPIFADASRRYPPDDEYDARGDHACDIVGD